jgi:hypothetical protein
VPGHWQGDIVVGKDGEITVVTLVDPAQVNLERRAPALVYFCVRAEKAEPRLCAVAPYFPAFCRYFARADERTRTADLLITSDK